MDSQLVYTARRRWGLVVRKCVIGGRPLGAIFWLFFATIFLYKSLIRTHFYPISQETHTFDLLVQRITFSIYKLSSLLHFPPYQPLKFKNRISFILKVVCVCVCIFLGCVYVCVCGGMFMCVFPQKKAWDTLGLGLQAVVSWQFCFSCPFWHDG